MNRVEIQTRLKAIEAEREKLNVEEVELKIQDLQICDDTQWYSEKTIPIIGKHKKKVGEMLAGFIHWNEDFTDEDTGNVITIERCQRVLEDGVWIII